MEFPTTGMALAKLVITVAKFFNKNEKTKQKHAIICLIVCTFQPKKGFTKSLELYKI